MVTKSKLLLALAAEKGIDFAASKEAKKRKQAIKKKAVQSFNSSKPNPHNESGRYKTLVGNSVRPHGDEDEDEDEDKWEDNEDSDAGSKDIDIEGINDSDSSGSEIELEARIERQPRPDKSEAASKTGTAGGRSRESASQPEKSKSQQEDEDGEDDEEEEDIPMSDLEDLEEDDRDDLVPHTRLTINNTVALATCLNRIAIPTDSSVDFASHHCVRSSGEPTADSFRDVSNDLSRELAFYAQSLEAVKLARQNLRDESVPFFRPNDFFAEMVKGDDHMDKVRAKLVEEASAKKAAAEARKQRDLKKFGKQVQVAKLQERQKAKKDTLNKIQELKRKRQTNLDNVGEREGDLFDVAIDNEMERYNSNKPATSRGDHAPNSKRHKKDEKYGFGGKKRHAKSGDAASSGDLSGFSARKMKTGAKSKARVTRPGKNRRKAMSSRT